MQNTATAPPAATTKGLANGRLQGTHQLEMFEVFNNAGNLILVTSSGVAAAAAAQPGDRLARRTWVAVQHTQPYGI